MAGEDLLSQLNALKAERDRIAAMPDDSPVGDSTIQPQGFWDAAMSQPGTDLWGGVKAPFELLGRVADNYSSGNISNPILGVPAAIGKTLYSGVDSLESGLERTRDLAVGAVPGAVTGFGALTDYMSGDLKSSAEYGRQFGQEVFGYAGGAGVTGAGLAALKAAPGIATGTRDFLAGMPEDARLVRQAGRDDIYANKLDFPNSGTLRENIQVGDAAHTSEAFTRNNPVAGIDNTLPGEQQVAQFQNNLKTIESTAIKTRNEILPKVAEAQEAAQANGISTTISFEDIPKSFNTEAGPLGLDTLRNKYGDAAVGLADNWVKKEFGMVPEYVGPAYEGAPMQMAPSRAISVQDANFLRQKIDGQIEAIGGYDNSYWAKLELDPSVGEGYAEALRFYRKQLDGVVKQRIGSVLGDEVAAAFTKAGEDISMTKTYAPMVERFQRATGQAFAPGSAKKVDAGVGPLGSRSKLGGVIDNLAPGRAKANLETQALTREPTMIRQLQKLVDFKMNQTKPIPRGWAQIKSSFQDLTNVGQIAMGMGLIGSIDQLTQMPDEQAKQVVGIVAMQAPQVFEPTPDKVDVLDGQYLNPMQKDGLTRQALEKDPATRYEVIGKGTLENKYVPLATSLPEATKPIGQVPGISDLNSMLGPILPAAPAISNSLEDQLNNAIYRHSSDYIQ